MVIWVLKRSTLDKFSDMYAKFLKLCRVPDMGLFTKIEILSGFYIIKSKKDFLTTTPKTKIFFYKNINMGT